MFTSMVLLCACSMGFAQTNNWSKRIVHKTTYPLAMLSNIHISPVDVLIIDGKRFENVRGMSKYYLQVPNTNSIVFVTDDENDHPTYHIFNMDTDEDIEFHSQDSSSRFGRHFGSPNSSPRESVAVDDDGMIVLCILDTNIPGLLSPGVSFNSAKELYYLDPKKKAIVADKMFYYDSAGKVIDENDATPPF
jgi:hypothetical protein